MAKDFAKRFGSLMLAGLFLVTTFAFTAIIFWQTRQQENNEATNQAIQEALNNQNDENSLKVDDNTGEDMLQGTKLEGFEPRTAPVTKLEIIDLKEGSGEVVPEGATITANYTGALVSTGIIFQSSLDTGQPFTSPLSNLISGWQEGIPGMKVGGIRRLVIPYAQAYGEAGSPPDIPAKSDLVFDIELISLEQ